jgi:hypothetical protein
MTIYDQNKTNVEQTLKEFNNLQPSIKFTIEKESHEDIHFVDLTIHRKDEKLEISTQTDVIIPNTRELSALLFFQFIYTKVGVEQVRHFST